MPFGTEYAIAFKIPDGKRRRLELMIDGTLITDSLIVSDGSVLERFVDSAKRFKFVAASDPGVVDPTSKENGDIVVKLWEEQPTVNIVDPNLYGYPQKPWDQPAPRPPSRPFDPLHTKLTCSSHVSTSALRGMSFGSASSSIQCSDQTGHLIGANMDMFNVAADKGATVEGGSSHQKFGSTTWQGDCGAPLIFTFRIRGRAEASPEGFDRPSACPCCKKRVPGGSRYCPGCGVEVAIALTR